MHSPSRQCPICQCPGHIKHRWHFPSAVPEEPAARNRSESKFHSCDSRTRRTVQIKTREEILDTSSDVVTGNVDRSQLPFQQRLGLFQRMANTLGLRDHTIGEVAAAVEQLEAEDRAEAAQAPMFTNQLTDDEPESSGGTADLVSFASWTDDLDAWRSVHPKDFTGTGFQIQGSEGDLRPIRTIEDSLEAFAGNTAKRDCGNPGRIQLPSGRMGVMLDIGSVGNLAGSQWVRSVSRKGMHDGNMTAKTHKRERPLRVSGVGTGGQTCDWNAHLPVCIKCYSGEGKTNAGFQKACYRTPVVPDSDLPALVGYDTLQHSRCLIDCAKDEVFLLAPGDYNLLAHLPPGSRQVETERATTGHLMMPIDHYQEFHDYQNRGGLELEEMVLVQDQYASNVQKALSKPNSWEPDTMAGGPGVVPFNQHVPKHLAPGEAQKIIDSGFPTTFTLPNGAKIIDKDFLHGRNRPGVGELSPAFSTNDPREVGDQLQPIDNPEVRKLWHATRSEGYPVPGLDYQVDGEIGTEWTQCPSCAEYFTSNSPGHRCSECRKHYHAGSCGMWITTADQRARCFVCRSCYKEQVYKQREFDLALAAQEDEHFLDDLGNAILASTVPQVRHTADPGIDEVIWPPGTELVLPRVHNRDNPFVPGGDPRIAAIARQGFAEPEMPLNAPLPYKEGELHRTPDRTFAEAYPNGYPKGQHSMQ